MEPAYISQISELLNNKLGANWESELGIPTIAPKPKGTNTILLDAWRTSLQPFKNRYLEKIREYGTNIFNLLNSSVLVGEFVGYSNFENEISQVQAIATGYINIYPTNPDIAEEFGEFACINLTKAIVEAVKIYYELYEKAKIKFGDKEEFFIGEFYSFDNFASHQIINSDSNWKGELSSFFSNVGVSLLDLILTPDESDYIRLQALHNYCDDGISVLNPLISTKCRFLKAKWLLRFQLTVQLTPVNIFRGKLNKLNTEEILSEEIAPWASYIKNHYEVDGLPSKRLFNVKSYQNFMAMSLFDIHRHIKYYKDIQPNYERLVEIKRTLTLRRNQIADTRNHHLNFDVFAYNIALSYSLNNCLSVIVSKQANWDKIDDVEILYKEIQQVQDDTKINNFFADFKYLKFLVQLLQHEFDNKRVLDDTTRARRIISKCQDIIKNYETNVRWSERYLNYVYCLPYKECLINCIEVNGINKIFIASSFVLPISEKKYIEDFNNLSNSLNKYSSSLEIFESVEEDIKNSRKSQWKQIEIIGIFTAIISFVASSLPTLTFVKDISQAFLFVFALGVSLVLFVSLLMIVGRTSFHKIRHVLPWTISLVLFAILAWGTLSYTSRNIATKDEIKNLNKSDSITTKSFERIENKYDSLFEQHRLLIESSKKNATPSTH